MTTPQEWAEAKWGEDLFDGFEDGGVLWPYTYRATDGSLNLVSDEPELITYFSQHPEYSGDIEGMEVGFVKQLDAMEFNNMPARLAFQLKETLGDDFHFYGDQNRS